MSGYGPEDPTEPRSVHRKQLTRRFTRPRPQPAPAEPIVGVPTPLLQLAEATHEPLAYLCSAIVPAIPLESPRLLLGRHTECHLMLPHKSVSRRHGLVKARGQVVVYEDLGSSNGSFVNGQQVDPKKPRVLRSGDKLTVGPYAFELRDVPDELLATSGERMLQRLRGEEERPALVGKIREVPLAEVVQGIEFNKKTCHLEVEDGDRRGVLVVRNGAPLRASWATLTGEQALLAMLALDHGQFYLTNRQTVEGERTIRTSLKLLLFESLRRRDEDVGDDFDTAQI